MGGEVCGLVGPVLGRENDMHVIEVRKMGVIEGDGVHLTSHANRVSVVALCYGLTSSQV
jgi:hypothetical protein